MVVLVVAVLAFVLFRGTFRDNQGVEPQPVEYLSVVAALQESGREVAYPPTLPEGWVATSVVAERGERPTWGLGILTDDERFVGIRQADVDAEDLLRTHVDEAVEPAEPLRVPGALATDWEGYADDGGDTAYVTTVSTGSGEETLVVYGSATKADLEAVIGLLTSDPVAEPSG